MAPSLLSNPNTCSFSLLLLQFSGLPVRFQSLPWEHLPQVPLRSIWITVSVFCGHTPVQPVSKSDYTHLCNSFSKSIHCKTDMLLIPPHSTSQNLFPFRSFVYLDLFISLFSSFPHIHTRKIPFHSKQHTNKSNQKCTCASRKTHMCTRTQTHLSL